MEKASIEIFMKHKYLFPYSYLDEEKLELSKPDKYNIYYVLKGPRYIIKSFEVLDQYNFIVTIINLTNNIKMDIILNVYEIFGVPNIFCLKLKITNNGSILQVEYLKQGMNFLYMFNHNLIKKFQENININECIKILFHVTQLFRLKFCEKDKIEEYELLYIGRTKRSAIYDRLYDHNTIPKIIRKLNKENDGAKYEIYILVAGVHIKLIEEEYICQFFTNIIASHTLDDNFLIKNGLISKKEVIDIAEAMLISYFKPQYNDKLTKSKNLETLSTYRIFNKWIIKSISYSLDLYFEGIKRKIALKTNTAHTNYRANILQCEFNKKGKINEITLDHLQDEVY